MPERQVLKPPECPTDEELDDLKKDVTGNILGDPWVIPPNPICIQTPYPPTPRVMPG
jgi:hypothetical protein